MDITRISEVVEYHESSNELKYRGSYLPSSDSVEAAVIFKNLANVKTIVHTHASQKFTRNKEYGHKVKVPIAPYGEYETGQLIGKALTEEEDGFIIMEDHGEVFTSSDETVSKTLMKYLGINQEIVK